MTATATKLKVGVVGAAGYAGGELLRLLLAHPRVEVAAAVSSTFPGKPAASVHPQLRRAAPVFTDALPAGLDVVFMAGGHGESAKALPSVRARRVIDLAADHRLDERFVYGLAELNRAAIARADLVANPGCFATAVALALAPLGPVKAAVTAVTGSSGSGASPSATTHHPAREGSMKAYKPLRHQHLAELGRMLPGAELSLVTVSGPFVRGIYAVCHVEKADRALYEKAYAGCPFVSLLDAPPDLKAVVGTNHCDLFVGQEGGKAVVIAAIDNLVKGAAGQAVQNLNLMMGWDETEGLELPGVYP